MNDAALIAELEREKDNVEAEDAATAGMDRESSGDANAPRKGGGPAFRVTGPIVNCFRLVF